MRKTVIFGALSACFLLAAAGCTTYYQVTDPTTGKSYYATQYKTSGSAIIIDDEKTRSKVTVQNSEVREISKEAYMERITNGQ